MTVRLDIAELCGSHSTTGHDCEGAKDHAWHDAFHWYSIWEFDGGEWVPGHPVFFDNVMRYRCVGLTAWFTPCGCEYREIADGRWEYRYCGPESDWDSEWTAIGARSLDDIKEYGHDLIEVDQ